MDSAIQKATAPQVLALGQTANVSNSFTDDGIRTVTIYSVTYPVEITPRVSQTPTAGKQYAVADVQVCRGTSWVA